MAKRDTRMARQNDIDQLAVKKVLKSGLRTGDIWESGRRRVGTREMGDAVLKARAGALVLQAIPFVASWHSRATRPKSVRRSTARYARHAQRDTRENRNG